MKHSTEYAKVDYHSVPKLVGAVVQGAARREVPQARDPARSVGRLVGGYLIQLQPQELFKEKK